MAAVLWHGEVHSGIQTLQRANRIQSVFEPISMVQCDCWSTAMKSLAAASQHLSLRTVGLATLSQGCSRGQGRNTMFTEILPTVCKGPPPLWAIPGMSHSRRGKHPAMAQCKGSLSPLSHSRLRMLWDIIKVPQLQPFSMLCFVHIWSCYHVKTLKSWLKCLAWPIIFLPATWKVSVPVVSAHRDI